MLIFEVSFDSFLLFGVLDGCTGHASHIGGSISCDLACIRFAS